LVENSRILLLPAGFFENINTFNEKREDKTKRKRNLERRKFQNEANQYIWASGQNEN
jgi:hypothetical protein